MADTTRSYEDLGARQQLYRVIEFCQDAGALWRKIESGQYDWLGVRESEGRTTFVLGRQRASRISDHASLTTSKLGSDGSHKVVLSVPHVPIRDESLFATADQARESSLKVRKVPDVAAAPLAG